LFCLSLAFHFSHTDYLKWIAVISIFIYIISFAFVVCRFNWHEETKLPQDLDYDLVPSLSNEVKYVLKKARPETIGIASRLSGMTPAAISLLLIYLKKRSG
jgi:tRNA U34 5-carboxymethylaminomethyl modifying enzyme MnmG/GidA